jgi:hypothetical protein
VFEAAELGSEVPKERLEAELPDLREADFPVQIVLVGDDRAGGSERFARVAVLRTVCDALARRVDAKR